MRSLNILEENVAKKKFRHLNFSDKNKFDSEKLKFYIIQFHNGLQIFIISIVCLNFSCED